jgi:hypothetical protein
MATSRPFSVLTQHRGSTASICCVRPGRQHARTSGCSLVTILSPLGVVPPSCRLPMLGKQVGLKIAHPAPDKQRLCGAPWREQRPEEVPDGGSSRCPAPLRPCTTSTSTSLPRPRGRCGVTHPQWKRLTFGSAAMGSRLRPLPRVALWANQRSWEGFGHSGGATSAAASQPIPRQHHRHRATGNPSTLINSIS